LRGLVLSWIDRSRISSWPTRAWRPSYLGRAEPESLGFHVLVAGLHHGDHFLPATDLLDQSRAREVGHLAKILFDQRIVDLLQLSHDDVLESSIICSRRSVPGQQQQKERDRLNLHS
jgi:hypothetical protein